MAKILVIDDDHSLLRALRLGLKAAGHEIITAIDAEQGLSQAALSAPDVIVLDIGLPDLDGLDVAARVRQWSDVPIIILSATGAEDRKIAALDGGANDYVTKPFSMGELEARVRAVLRTSPVAAGQEVTELAIGGLELDLVHHDVRLDGTRVELTGKEFGLLAFLGHNAGRTCTYQMILRAVWGVGYGDEAQYVHAYVHRLRQKLHDDDAEYIETVPGVGYRLRLPDDAS